MSGQAEAALLRDLTLACNTLILIYPINNVITQKTLHKSLAKANLEPTSAVRKFSMNLLIDEYMRSRGYILHNGHGYRKLDKHDRKTIILNKRVWMVLS